MDIVVPEVSPYPHSTLHSSALKALAKLVGVTDELQEFDLRPGLFVKAKVHKPYLLS